MILKVIGDDSLSKLRTSLAGVQLCNDDEVVALIVVKRHNNNSRKLLNVSWKVQSKNTLLYK